MTQPTRTGATDNGIAINNYIEERDRGIIAISKVAASSENYVFYKANFQLFMDNGEAKSVEGNPDIRGINRMSLQKVEEQLKLDEENIANMRLQLKAISDDMDACDLEAANKAAALKAAREASVTAA